MLLYWIAGIGIVFHCKHNNKIHSYIQSLACSKRSDSGERWEVKKALLFTSHRSPLSELLEQAIQSLNPILKILQFKFKYFKYGTKLV